MGETVGFQALPYFLVYAVVLLYVLCRDDNRKDAERKENRQDQGVAVLPFRVQQVKSEKDTAKNQKVNGNQGLYNTSWKASPVEDINPAYAGCIPPP